MTHSDLPDGVVPILDYSRRESPNSDHGPDYKNLQRALEAGTITRIQRGKRLFVIQHEAEQLLASIKAKSKASGGVPAQSFTALERRLAATEKTVSQLEKTVSDLLDQLGCRS